MTREEKKQKQYTFMEAVREVERRVPRKKSLLPFLMGAALGLNILFPCKDARYYGEEAKQHASSVAQQAGWEWANVEDVDIPREGSVIPCTPNEVAYRIWGVGPDGKYSHGTVCCSLDNISDCPIVYKE